MVKIGGRGSLQTRPLCLGLPTCSRRCLNETARRSSEPGILGRGEAPIRWGNAGSDAARRRHFCQPDRDYRRSPEWRAKADSTHQLNERHLKIIAEILWRQACWRLRASRVLQIRDAIAAEGTLRKADHVVSMLSTMIAWGIPREYAETNPCREIGKVSGGDGWPEWEEADVEYARQNLPARLWHAAALALHSGQRQGDLLRMDWAMIREGVLHVRQEKTGTRLWIPLHRNLAAVLETIPRTSTRILTNASGRPWQSGFKASWQDAMNTPAFSDFRARRLVFHGLRKSAVNTLLEAGCTEAQVSAVTGQSAEMIRHCSRW